MLRLVPNGTRGQTGLAALKRATVDFPDEVDTAEMGAAVLETNMTRKCARLTSALFGKIGANGAHVTKSAEEAGRKESEPAKMAVLVNAAVSATTKSKQVVTQENVQLGNPGRTGLSAALRVESDASIDTDTATTKENAKVMKRKVISALLEHALLGRAGEAGQNARSLAEAAGTRRDTENAAARDSANLTLTRKTPTRNSKNVVKPASAHLGTAGRVGVLVASHAEEETATDRAFATLQANAMGSQLLERSVTLRHVQLQRHHSGNPGPAGLHAAYPAVVDLNSVQEAAAETPALDSLDSQRLATTRLVLYHQFGDHGQAGRLVVNLAMAVSKLDREAATDRHALAKRKIRIHATRSSAQLWNLGANGLPAIVALKNERELGTAHDLIRDLSVQKNLNSSKAAFARLDHQQNSLHILLLQRHKRQRMKL